ncbi:conserved hypothetical protein [uncultured Pleomorphomonas sp.]|uniref:DUF374 domain-containing protein n=2 Tax=Pleomorphomonas TaxID=261933 RepID=A0A2G9WY12_9HYPH|nr:DUF374 domain-containing protein [Pleomorphomonas carboxyditropha]PIO99559.1 hypothetical protein CJ014_09630 [Pleomorphomonas carboxyditropha]SCM76652.1 conserved hypothetical protein [uncultured Pleomorphomonas sp.]
MRLDRKILGNAAVSRVLPYLLARYVLAVRRTARLTVMPPDALDVARAEAPAIFTFWHGLAMMARYAIPSDLPFVPMVARNAAASLIAEAAGTVGVRTIRASGAQRARAQHKKGGATGFRQALRELAAGNSVMMTADVPKVAQVSGRGVIQLARLSGRPIIPVAYVSRYGLRFNNWDRMVVDLPFSPATLRHGAPIHVPADADDEAVERLRRSLTEELDRITQDAYQRTGIAKKFTPGPTNQDLAADG